MVDIWFVSDTHFNHANILNFKDDKGNLIRPGFKDVDHMNNVMIDNWNKVVKPQDKIYHLGDVSFGNGDLMIAILKRLNGHKRLVMGNHDIYDILYYAEYFEKVSSWRQFMDMPKPFVCTHYPLHPGSFEYRGAVWNVHGHIHQNVVMKSSVPDNRYINICVEKTNYTPIHLDELMSLMK